LTNGLGRPEGFEETQQYLGGCPQSGLGQIWQAAIFNTDHGVKPPGETGMLSPQPHQPLQIQPFLSRSWINHETVFEIPACVPVDIRVIMKQLIGKARFLTEALE